MVFMCQVKDSDRCIQDAASFTKIVTGMYRQDSMLHRLLKCNPEVPPTTTEQKRKKGLFKLLIALTVAFRTEEYNREHELCLDHALNATLHHTWESGRFRGTTVLAC